MNNEQENKQQPKRKRKRIVRELKPVFSSRDKDDDKSIDDNKKDSKDR